MVLLHERVTLESSHLATIIYLSSTTTMMVVAPTKLKRSIYSASHPCFPNSKPSHFPSSFMSWLCFIYPSFSPTSCVTVHDKHKQHGNHHDQHKRHKMVFSSTDYFYILITPYLSSAQPQKNGKEYRHCIISWYSQTDSCWIKSHLNLTKPPTTRVSLSSYEQL